MLYLEILEGVDHRLMHVLVSVLVLMTVCSCEDALQSDCWNVNVLTSSCVGDMR